MQFAGKIFFENFQIPHKTFEKNNFENQNSNFAQLYHCIAAAKKTKQQAARQWIQRIELNICTRLSNVCSSPNLRLTYKSRFKCEEKKLHKNEKSFGKNKKLKLKTPKFTQLYHCTAAAQKTKQQTRRQRILTRRAQFLHQNLKCLFKSKLTINLQIQFKVWRKNLIK